MPGQEIYSCSGPVSPTLVLGPALALWRAGICYSYVRRVRRPPSTFNTLVRIERRQRIIAGAKRTSVGALSPPPPTRMTQLEHSIIQPPSIPRHLRVMSFYAELCRYGCADCTIDP